MSILRDVNTGLLHRLGVWIVNAELVHGLETWKRIKQILRGQVWDKILKSIHTTLYPNNNSVTLIFSATSLGFWEDPTESSVDVFQWSQHPERWQDSTCHDFPPPVVVVTSSDPKKSGSPKFQPIEFAGWCYCLFPVYRRVWVCCWTTGLDWRCPSECYCRFHGQKLRSMISWWFLSDSNTNVMDLGSLRCFSRRPQKLVLNDELLGRTCQRRTNTFATGTFGRVWQPRSGCVLWR